jgi:hypothetical protein
LVADNNQDFSLYPARNACKTIGGKLPTVTQLSCIYNNKASYGSFQPSGSYWSSTEDGANYAFIVYFNAGYTDYGTKSLTNRFVRCVR